MYSPKQQDFVLCVTVSPPQNSAWHIAGAQQILEEIGEDERGKGERINEEQILGSCP